MIQVWMQWFEESSSEESPPDDKDDEDSDLEEDVVMESDHDSSSEQEAGPSDLDNEQSDATSSNHFYMGKDKKTKWRKSTPNVHVRTRAHNIIIHLPGPKGAASNAKSVTECFNLMLDDAIIRIISTCTNIYIDEIRTKFERERDCRKTDEREIRAFIGILYLIGVLRSSLNKI